MALGTWLCSKPRTSVNTTKKLIRLFVASSSCTFGYDHLSFESIWFSPQLPPSGKNKWAKNAHCPSNEKTHLGRPWQFARKKNIFLVHWLCDFRIRHDSWFGFWIFLPKIESFPSKISIFFRSLRKIPVQISFYSIKFSQWSYSLLY